MGKGTVEQLRIADVVVDETMYPRHKLSAHNIAQIKDGYLSGSDVPPIVVWKSKRILVDGQHRLMAKQQIVGPEGMIDALLIEYDSKRDALADAVKRNSAQGYRLTTWDKVRSIMLLQAVKADEDTIARSLNCSLDTVHRLAERIKESAEGPIATKGGSEVIAEAAKVTKAQVERTVGADSGMHVTFHLNQIIGKIKAKMIKWDEKTVALFDELIELYQEATA